MIKSGPQAKIPLHYTLFLVGQSVNMLINPTGYILDLEEYKNKKWKINITKIFA